MHLVDEGRGTPARCLQAEASAAAPVPGLELYLCAASAFAVVIALIVRRGIIVETVGRRAIPGLYQEVVLVHQRRI